MHDLWMTAGLLASAIGAAALLALALRSRRRGAAQQNAAAQREGRRKGGLRALGSWLRPDEAQALEALKTRAMRAGLYDQDAIDLFLTVRLITVAAGGGLFLLTLVVVEHTLTQLALLVLIVAVTALGPNRWLERRVERRQAAVAEGLPDLLDLLALCLEAGLGLEKALERTVSSRSAGDLLGDEMEMVLGDLRMGVSVERAFSRFAARIGSEEANALASVIGKASALGAQIGELLRNHARSMREQRLIMLEEFAGKANAKLSLPLAVFLMPAGLILLLAPPFMALFRML